MKHKVRKEKICLNCGSPVEDMYCPHCGQENIEPRQSFGNLFYHFFSDFTHFDSKLFTTIKDLIWRPGFLTKQYLAGKRKSYLDPVRMYIFISFVFFLGTGLMHRDTEKKMNESGGDNSKAVATALQASLDSLKADSTVDSATLNRIALNYKNIESQVSSEYSSIQEYDSIEARQPLEKRDGRIEQYLMRKKIEWNNKYPGRMGEMLKDKFIHSIPKAMFVLLPLFALFLKWFYRKKTYYFDHAIFSLHFHSFAFLSMFILWSIDYFFKMDVLSSFGFLLMFIYLVLALRNTYHQSFIRSFFKAIALCIFYFFGIFIVVAFVGIIIFITV